MEKPYFIPTVKWKGKKEKANKEDMYLTKEIEEIASRRTRGTKTEYLVKWKGYSQLVFFILFFITWKLVLLVVMLKSKLYLMFKLKFKIFVIL